MSIAMKGNILFDDFRFHKGEVITEGDVIREVRVCEDVPDDYIIPGLIDLHFHGAMGSDVCDGEYSAFETIAEYELSHGITSICPATLTLPEEELEKTLSLGARFAADNKDSVKRAELVGFNMEGPFISYSKKGAQNPDYIRKADVATALRFLEASGGLLKIMGLAPEESENYPEYIQALKDKMRISLAHTGADYDTAAAAIKYGASHAVHLYNAMTGFTHRNPGVVGAVFDSDNVTAELICDGIHVHPAAVRTAFRELGDDRIVLISDSLRSTGMPDGEYELGGQTTRKDGPRCTLADGTIAGSVSNLCDCMVNVVKTMEIPLETAAKCASYNPARVLGISDRLGSITPGKQADMLLLDRDLNLKQVIKRGARV